MSTDTYETEPQQRKSNWSGCLMGCAVAFGILLLILVIGGWWVSQNWRGMVSKMAAQGIDAMIDESDLPAEEKTELKAEAKRVTDGFSDGTISDQQMERIMTGVIESPLLTMFMVQAVEAKYLDQSGLSDEEKAEGKVTLQRYARGLVDEKISEGSIDQVLTHIADKDAEGQWQLRDKVSDEELRAFLAAAKQEADQAEIPEQIEPIDPSDELKRIIDQALEGPAANEEPVEELVP